MVQKRIKDFAAPANAEDLKDLTNALTTPGVMQGFRFQVDGPSRMRIEPGIAITHEGVVVIEDENLFEEIENTSNAVDYTIYYAHEDQNISGGVKAELTVAQGLFSSDDILGVILGYVKYPGGGTPLSQSHFIQAPTAQLSNYTPNRDNVPWTIPINNNGFLKTLETNATLTLNDVYETGPTSVYLRVRNDNIPPGNGQLELTFPFKVDDIPFSLVQFNMQIDNSVAVNVTLVDTSDQVRSLHIGQLQPQPNLFLHNLTIPREAILNPNKLCFLKFSFDVPITRTIKLQGVGLSSYNLPV